MLALFVLNFVPLVAGLWQTIFVETPGNADETPFTLNYPSFAAAVQGKSYRIQLSWGASFVQFLVPAGTNIFDQTVSEQSMPISSLNFSPDISFFGKQGSSAYFCHACTQGTFQWGYICWGVLLGPGCKRTEWSGPGIYYISRASVGCDVVSRCLTFQIDLGVNQATTFPRTSVSSTTHFTTSTLSSTTRTSMTTSSRTLTSTKSTTRSAIATRSTSSSLSSSSQTMTTSSSSSISYTSTTESLSSSSSTTATTSSITRSTSTMTSATETTTTETETSFTVTRTLLHSTSSPMVLISDLTSITRSVTASSSTRTATSTISGTTTSSTDSSSSSTSTTITSRTTTSITSSTTNSTLTSSTTTSSTDSSSSSTSTTSTSRTTTSITSSTTNSTLTSSTVTSSTGTSSTWTSTTRTTTSITETTTTSSFSSTTVTTTSVSSSTTTTTSWTSTSSTITSSSTSTSTTSETMTVSSTTTSETTTSMTVDPDAPVSVASFPSPVFSVQSSMLVVGPTEIPLERRENITHILADTLGVSEYRLVISNIGPTFAIMLGDMLLGDSRRLQGDRLLASKAIPGLETVKALQIDFQVILPRLVDSNQLPQGSAGVGNHTSTADVMLAVRSLKNSTQVLASQLSTVLAASSASPVRIRVSSPQLEKHYTVFVAEKWSICGDGANCITSGPILRHRQVWCADPKNYSFMLPLDLCSGQLPIDEESCPAGVWRPPPCGWLVGSWSFCLSDSPPNLNPVNLTQDVCNSSGFGLQYRTVVCMKANSFDECGGSTPPSTRRCQCVATAISSPNSLPVLTPTLEASSSQPPTEASNISIALIIGLSVGGVVCLCCTSLCCFVACVGSRAKATRVVPGDFKEATEGKAKIADICKSGVSPSYQSSVSKERGLITPSLELHEGAFHKPPTPDVSPPGLTISRAPPQSYRKQRSSQT